VGKFVKALALTQSLPGFFCFLSNSGSVTPDPRQTMYRVAVFLGNVTRCGAKKSIVKDNAPQLYWGAARPWGKFVKAKALTRSLPGFFLLNSD